MLINNNILILMLSNDHVFHEQEYTQLLKPNYNPRTVQQKDIQLWKRLFDY